MQPTLTTDRLTLRPAVAEDVAWLRTTWDAAEVRRYLFDDQPVDDARAAAVLDDCLALARQGLGLWIVERRDDGRPLGCAGLVPVSEAGRFHPPSSGGTEPVIALDPRAFGHGYAGEALGELVAHAFGTLGLERLHAAVDVPNEASIRLVERVGFRGVAESDGPRYPLRHFVLERGDRSAPAVLVVVGASGAGKSTLVRGLDALALDGVHCHHFDALGVPSAAEIEARWGGGAGWQRWALDEWMRRLTRNAAGARLHVLDAQVRPHDAREALATHGVTHGRVVLVDCAYAERNRRLREDRRQPELATPDMDCFAAYMRGQADALALPIVDTTTGPPDAALVELRRHAEALLAARVADASVSR